MISRLGKRDSEQPLGDQILYDAGRCLKTGKSDESLSRQAGSDEELADGRERRLVELLLLKMAARMDDKLEQEHDQLLTEELGSSFPFNDGAHSEHGGVKRNQFNPRLGR